MFSRTALRQITRSLPRAARPNATRVLARLNTPITARTYSSAEAMACRQCEQTQDSKMCTTIGVCGKTPETSALQDLLVWQLKGLGAWAAAARAAGASAEQLAKVDAFMPAALFSTLTNVNFDSERIAAYIHEAAAFRASVSELVASLGGKAPTAPSAAFVPAAGASVSELEAAARANNNVGIEGAAERVGEDRACLLELITYGLKGLCAYSEHARVLGAVSDADTAAISELLALLATEDHSVDELLAAALRVGEVNLRVTQLLEEAHANMFGKQEPTDVRTHAAAGKCILVSGHDMRDLEMVLEATAGKGINVYTHGEMLPGHAYPALKKHAHLVGHYGTAWQNQKLEFAAFPGAVLMTTNCIIQPMKSYRNRIFTRSAVGWPGVTHIDAGDDFAPLVDAALAAKGFAADEAAQPPLTIGYGKDTVLSVAGAVVDAVKTGAVSRFYFIGGCDGSEGERNYFTDLAKAVPDDAIILTAGCAKFRMNRLLQGQTVGPFPKLLDAGQCNDISGVVAIAGALADAFETDVNGLPLELAVSWLEQKAVAQLLTCLHLGIKGIHLGPNLPAFVTPNVLDVLVKTFDLAPTTTPEQDFPGKLLTSQ